MNKQEELDKIARDIEKCKVCKIGKSGKAVPGEGNPDAEIVFVGEAPGKNEAMTGRPFVGRSGKLLRSLINLTGLKEEEVFITSPVKYLPDRGTPSMSDIAHGRMHIEAQLRVIDPKLIVLLGSVAATAILQYKVPVKKDHGKVIDKDNRKYIVTLHPAAALRFPSLLGLIKEDFQKLKSLI